MDIHEFTQEVIFYLLVGAVISFVIEWLARFSDDNLTMGERALFITLWPIMGGIFLYHFIKELLQ
jgi:NhaP-type Na+/H+ or K+/H+ antiporter